MPQNSFVASTLGQLTCCRIGPPSQVTSTQVIQLMTMQHIQSFSTRTSAPQHQNDNLLAAREHALLVALDDMPADELLNVTKESNPGIPDLANSTPWKAT